MRLTPIRPRHLGWPPPHEIVAEFWQQRVRLTQSMLDALVARMGIPVAALASSVDRADFPAVAWRVRRDRRTYEFDPAGKLAIGFVAWSTDGAAVDLVAWSPRDAWIGSWLGRAVVLGEHELATPRIDGLDEPIGCFFHAADWLREHRKGLVIIDELRAPSLLEGVTLRAIDVNEGLKLRRMLERPRARIVVDSSSVERRAA